MDNKTKKKNFERRKRLGNNENLSNAFDDIENKFDNDTAVAIIDNENETCVIKYAKSLIQENEKMPALNNLLNVEKITQNHNECEIDKYITLKEYQVFQKSEIGTSISINSLDLTIKSKRYTNGKPSGEGESFLNNHFRHDTKKRNGGDFWVDDKKVEVKTNGSRLRGSDGFGNLGSVRTQILKAIKTEKWINEEAIRNLCIQNETQTWNTKKKRNVLNGHAFFFPEEVKRGKKTFFLPNVYKCLSNEAEEKKIKDIIFSAFCDHLYKKLLSLKNENNLNDKLKSVINLMLYNEVELIDEEWKNFNEEYYWIIEGKPIMIIFNKVNGIYHGFYITNNIEAFKRHTAPAKRPAVKSSAGYDAGWAVTYR